MSDPAARRAPRSNWTVSGLAVHLVVVILMSLIFLILSWQPTVDADIGAGLAAFPLLVLGLPWSALSYLSSNTHHDWQLSLVGAAFLNVIIHGGALLRRPSA